MTTPIDPAAANAAIRVQMAEQAQAVTGTPSAGVYGDVAGAEAPPVPLDLSKAKAGVVDVDALLQQLQAQAEALQGIQAKLAEQEAAANPEPEPPDTRLYVDGNAPGWLHALVAKLEDR